MIQLVRTLRRLLPFLPSSAKKFLGIFAVTQVPLAVVEGLVGVLLLNALITWARPELEDLQVVPADTVETTEATRA